MFGLSDERKLGLAAIGTGLSQLSAGQPVNIAASPAAQMLQDRQQRNALKESGVWERFTPEQQAILAQMPAAAATKIISGEVFRRPEPPAKGVVVNGQLVNPTTGAVIGDYRSPEAPEDSVRVISGEDASAMGLDPTRAYEVTTDPTGNLKNVSGIGGGDTNVSVDLGRQLTPGQEAVDKAFADTYIKWTTGGGADAANQAAQINSVLQQLEAGEPLTGPQVGLVPDFARALINPSAKDAQERVESVVQRSLRETLGAQFAQAEGDRLIARAYNPSLPPEANASRLRALYTKLESAAKAKQAMVDYFAEKGTLMGYDGPGMPTIADFEAALESVPVPDLGAGPVEGVVEYGYRFLGGDPTNPESWEEVK